MQDKEEDDIAVKKRAHNIVIALQHIITLQCIIILYMTKLFK